jgi:hypothetical protein
MYNANISSLNITNNLLLKQVKATGSKLTSIDLPEGGILETLLLGSDL